MIKKIMIVWGSVITFVSLSLSMVILGYLAAEVITNIFGKSVGLVLLYTIVWAGCVVAGTLYMYLICNKEKNDGK